MHLDCRPSTRPVNWAMTLLGISYFIYRLICMQAFIVVPETPFAAMLLPESVHLQGYFHPTVMHVSYITAILNSLALIANLRFRVLNAVSVVVLPTVLITIPFKDIAILLGPAAAGYPGNAIGSLFWANYLALHWPVLALGIYMLLTRRYTLSRSAIAITTVLLTAWFLFMDDWVNEVLNGAAYAMLVIPALYTWSAAIALSTVKRRTRDEDPLFAPLIEHPDGFKLVK